MLDNIIPVVAQQVNITGNVTLPTLPVITLENVFGDLTSTLILITLMIAITVRQSSEFFAKVYNGEVTKFNPRYAIQGVIAFISAFPIAVPLVGSAAVVFVTYFGSLGLAGALFMVAVYGYGWAHAINKGASAVGHFFSPSASKAQITGESQELKTKQQPISTDSKSPVDPEAGQA